VRYGEASARYHAKRSKCACRSPGSSRPPRAPAPACHVQTVASSRALEESYSISPSTRSLCHRIAHCRLSAPGDDGPRVGRTWQQASDTSRLSAEVRWSTDALSPPLLAGPLLGLDRPAISARHSSTRPRLVPTPSPDSPLSLSTCPHAISLHHTWTSSAVWARNAYPLRTRILGTPATSDQSDMVKAQHVHNPASAVIAATQNRIRL
jgi:hypothetical protein